MQSESVRLFTLEHVVDRTPEFLGNQNEQWLLPPSLDELVPENHFVRIVSKTVDELRIEEIFVATVKLLNKKGYVSLEKYFVDGTKIESAANKYTKEDHMLNGQLKPGYNIQVRTENFFVIGYDVFPNPTDTRTFPIHPDNVMQRLGCKFKTAIADAGYGSEENYDYLEERKIIGAVKYTSYEKETKRSFKKKKKQEWNGGY